MDYPIVLKSQFLDRMTDDEFFHFCVEHPNLRIERSADLEITIMSPTGGVTSHIEAEIGFQLLLWNHQSKLGRVSNSNGAFHLPNRAIWAPDAAFVTSEKWNALSEREQMSFPNIVPDFIVEVRSFSDPIKQLRAKMEGWIEVGVSLAWLIDPFREFSEIYRVG